MIVRYLLLFFVFNQYWIIVLLDLANLELNYGTDLIAGSSLTVTDLKALSDQVNHLLFRHSVGYVCLFSFPRKFILHELPSILLYLLHNRQRTLRKNVKQQGMFIHIVLDVMNR
jgi:hypothetical protein